MIRRPPRSTRTDTRFPYDALPISATLRDLADIAYGETERLPDGMDAGLEIQYRYRPPPITMTSAAHACIVEVDADRSEEHTSELQSLMRISYAVFCLKKKHKHKSNNKYTKKTNTTTTQTDH